MFVFISFVPLHLRLRLLYFPMYPGSVIWFRAGWLCGLLFDAPGVTNYMVHGWVALILFLLFVCRVKSHTSKQPNYSSSVGY